MGFDFFVGLRFQIHPDTGLPCIWNNHKLIPFNPAEYIVPEEHRRFITQRGRILYEYIGDVESNDSCEAEILDLLEAFPSWSDIEPISNGSWTEEDHTSFYSALQWFSEKPGYYAYWSY